MMLSLVCGTDLQGPLGLSGARTALCSGEGALSGILSRSGKTMPEREVSALALILLKDEDGERIKNQPCLRDEVSINPSAVRFREMPRC